MSSDDMIIVGLAGVAIGGLAVYFLHQIYPNVLAVRSPSVQPRPTSNVNRLDTFLTDTSPPRNPNDAVLI